MKIMITVLLVLLGILGLIVGLGIHMNNYFTKKLDDMNKGDFE